MTGRNFFDLFYPVIYFFALFFSILPSFLIRFLWSVSSPFSGKLAVLLRYCLVAKRFKKTGHNVYFGTSVVLKNYSDAIVGCNVSVHDFCYIDGVGGLEIGDDVSIAHNCSIITFNHTWDDLNLPIKYNPISNGKVVIEDDVWVGCGVRIMPGVRIGKRSIIAAGSVITKDVLPGTIVGGVPARVIKEISQ